MTCTNCGHAQTDHVHSGGKCYVAGCACEKFTDRIDPSPPSSEDGDDDGNPGAI